MFAKVSFPFTIGVPAPGVEKSVLRVLIFYIYHLFDLYANFRHTKVFDSKNLHCHLPTPELNPANNRGAA